MASENEASCESDPNFAVICCFLEKFGVTCGLSNIDFLDLQEMLENTQEVSQDLIELHIKLLRKAKKSVANERWERAIIKMCHSYCSQDAWELERFGYKKSRIGAKLRILKHLLEMQFDLNQKFKNEINKMSAEELRTQPLGKDRLGNAYWCQCDEACQIRVYKEDPDEETWSLVARDREGLVSLISQLSSGDSAKSSSEPVSNEDSNSVEVEKPILDTGQMQDSSNSCATSATSAEQLPDDDGEDTSKTNDTGILNLISESHHESVTDSNNLEKSPERTAVALEISEEESTLETEVKEIEKPCPNNEQEIDLKEKPVENSKEDLTELSEDSKLDTINNSPEVVDDVLNLSYKNDETLKLAANYSKITSDQFEYNSESKTGLDLSFKPKPTLRLKPLKELLGKSKAGALDIEKREFIGIKGKYIRTDSVGDKVNLPFSSYSNSLLHRKAVQSASLDAISYKRAVEEDDVEEVPFKHSRPERPTLLGNKKFTPLYEDNVSEVEDEVEEPLMLVQGESSGYENECHNTRKAVSPILSEEIEEPTLYIFGEGYGKECQTGNENVIEKDAAQSANTNKKDLQLNVTKDLPSSSGLVFSPPRAHYKLGTIIDTKTDKVIVRTPVKKSRWDVIPDIHLSAAETEITENKSINEVSSSKEEELCGKFEDFCDSQVNVRRKLLIDNNSDSAISENQNQSDKGKSKLSGFFFGNSSVISMQSASLNFGASKNSACLKSPTSEVSNISKVTQESTLTSATVSKVPEILSNDTLQKTASESALQISSRMDEGTDATTALRNNECDNDDGEDFETVKDAGNDCNQSVLSTNLDSRTDMNIEINCLENTNVDEHLKNKMKNETDTVDKNQTLPASINEPVVRDTNNLIGTNSESENKSEINEDLKCTQKFAEKILNNANTIIACKEENIKINVVTENAKDVQNSGITDTSSCDTFLDEHIAETQKKNSDDKDNNKFVQRDTVSPLTAQCKEGETVETNDEKSDFMRNKDVRMNKESQNLVESFDNVLSSALNNEENCNTMLKNAVVINKIEVTEKTHNIGRTGSTEIIENDKIKECSKIMNVISLKKECIVNPKEKHFNELSTNEEHQKIQENPVSRDREPISENFNDDENSQLNEAQVNKNIPNDLGNSVKETADQVFNQFPENRISNEMENFNADENDAQVNKNSSNDLANSVEETADQIFNQFPENRFSNEHYYKKVGEKETNVGSTLSTTVQQTDLSNEMGNSVHQLQEDKETEKTLLVAPLNNESKLNLVSEKNNLDSTDDLEPKIIESTVKETTQENEDVEINQVPGVSLERSELEPEIDPIRSLDKKNEFQEINLDAKSENIPNEKEHDKLAVMKSDRKCEQESQNVLKTTEGKADECNKINSDEKIKQGSENTESALLQAKECDETDKHKSEIKQSEQFRDNGDEVLGELSGQNALEKVNKVMKNAANIEAVNSAIVKLNDTNEKKIQMMDDNLTNTIKCNNNMEASLKSDTGTADAIKLDTVSSSTSVQESISDDTETLQKVVKKRIKKPKLLNVEKRELRSRREENTQGGNEKLNSKTDSGSSSEEQVKTTKGGSQIKNRITNTKTTLNLRVKRVAVPVVPKIRAKKMVILSTPKTIAGSKKTDIKRSGQTTKKKVEKPSRFSERNKNEARPKTTVVTKVMKKPAKTLINVKLSRRQNNAELVEKSEIPIKKGEHKRKAVELAKKETSEIVVKKIKQTNRATEIKRPLDAGRNVTSIPGKMNLMIPLQRCDATVFSSHNEERIMTLRKRKPKPLGVIKQKQIKEKPKKKVEDVNKKDTGTVQLNITKVNIEEHKQDTTSTDEKLKFNIALNKIGSVSIRKIGNANEFSNLKTIKSKQNLSVKSCKNVAETTFLRRSGRRRATNDGGSETNENNSCQELIKVETAMKQNDCDVIAVMQHENPNFKNIKLESIETLSKRFKFSDNKVSVVSNKTIVKYPSKEENDPLKINTFEEQNKITASKDMETIDLTLENDTVPVSSSTQHLYQEKLTDCKQGVIIKGVLIKGDVTIKVKERIPVEETPCIKKSVPLLTCVNIEKLKEVNTKTCPDFSVASSPMSESGGGDNNSDVVIVEDDPLADILTPIESAPAPPLTLSSLKLDSTEPLANVTTRTLRKRARIEQPDQIAEENGCKKRKMKGKRPLDSELRRSIEEKKRLEVSSSEDDSGGRLKKREKFLKSKNKKNVSNSPACINLDSPDPITLDSPSTILVDSPTVSTTNSDIITKQELPVVKKRSPPKKRKKTLLGLDIPSPSAVDFQNDSECTVRQSRRIAQLKIKEEAERRKLEEITMHESKIEKKHKSKKSEDKDYKAEKRKKNKNLIIEEDIAVDVPEVDDKKKKRKRKHKHKDPRKIFDESNPWRSSSDSSTSNEEDEDEEIAEYSEAESPLFRSDHEFSPESDLEEGEEVQPLKRARTARKEDDVEEDVDDHACQKCGKQDHPEWILLCDGCDNGWHCSCLRPALLIIPEGDWFCPPCQHLSLIKNLEGKLAEYDKKLTKRDIEVRRKERLAYVGISLANVLPVKEPNDQKRNRKTKGEEKEEESESEESESETESSSDDSDSDEPIYQLRERRQAHSYRFNDYDELINSAIQEEVEAKGAGNQGRGKDIATIANSEKEEALDKQNQEPEPLPPVVPLEGKDVSHVLQTQQDNDSSSDEIKPVRKLIGRKKPRKLNCLDISSGDDRYSDEDFKGSSSAEEEDEYDEDMGSGSSEDDYGRKREFGPIRRSTRARTSRYDKEFINDDSEDDVISKRKKIKSAWNDSESEESDLSWKSKRKRRGGSKRQCTQFRKKSSKKGRRILSDSDSDAFKKKKPKIKYGGLDENEDVGRRTRGKRINYVDALASDSDEEIKKRGPPRIESDEEYDANEEQDVQDDDEEEDDDVEQEKGTKGIELSKAEQNLQAALELCVADAEINLQQETTEPVASLGIEKSPFTEKNALQDRENEDDESELNPIEEMNKNLEQMNEKEMERLMEEEEYANKQLQLMAMQLEKEKRRKEQEARKLDKVITQEPKTLKKRGRKPKALQVNSTAPIATLQVGPDMISNPELSEPPGVTIPIFGDYGNVTPESTPKKRRGRGKGKKTLEKEQAAAAAAAGTVASSNGTSYNTNSSSSEHVPPVVESVPPTPTSSTNASVHPAQLTVATAPQPFSQSQPTPSVITRMLQTQPAQGNFTTGMPHKYFAVDQQSPHSDSTSGPPEQGQYIHGGQRILAPPYRQPLQNINTYPHARGNTTQAHHLRASTPQGMPPVYHSHHPLDPSPSGGGPINVPVGPINMTAAPPSGTLNASERNSPVVAPPPADSPLSNKSDQTPPPPPYTRPQMTRFPQDSSSSLMSHSPVRHQHLIAPQHVQQARTNLPYHPGMPSSYYGSYIHPSIATEESLTPSSYQYPEQFSDGSSPQDNCKSYEEENSGEFGGLVSYFSSQREDDLDT